MLYNVTGEFVKVTETGGTIQNNSQAFTVEISDNTDEDSGYLLRPLNRVSFSGDIYVRCTEGGGRAQVNVVSFITDSGGSSSGGSYVDDSSVAPDSDIDNLIDDIFGDDSGSTVDDSQVASDEDIDSLLDDIFGSDDTSPSAAPSVATDADIDSLIEDIFTNGVIFPDDTSPSTTDGVLVDDSQVASDEDIDNLIDNIFG